MGNEPSEKRAVLKFDGKTKIILAILGVLALPQLWETINNFQDNVLTSKEKKEQRLHEARLEEIKQKKYLDSILNIERIRFNEIAARDAERVIQNLKYVSRTLKEVNSIAILKEHDGGEPLATGSFKYLTIIYAENNITVTDVKKDLYHQPLNTWQQHYISKAKLQGYTYYRDLSKVTQYTENIPANDYGTFIGNKSVMMFKIKATGQANYFFQVTFKIIDPHLENEFLRLKLENINNRLKDLIYEVPEHLKYN